MDINTFYAVTSATCFTLVGLWWSVVKDKADWFKDEAKKRLAGGVYASFLIPGLMSLGAQVGGTTSGIWQPVWLEAVGESGAGTLAQGYLEGANVRAVDEMVGRVLDLRHDALVDGPERVVVSPATGQILHPQFHLPLGEKARQYRFYRRIDNGPMTLVGQGLQDYSGPGSNVLVEDPAPPVSNGRVDYFSQFLDENGVASTMRKRLLSTSRRLPWSICRGGSLKASTRQSSSTPTGSMR